MVMLQFKVMTRNSDKFNFSMLEENHRSGLPEGVEDRVLHGCLKINSLFLYQTLR